MTELVEAPVVNAEEVSDRVTTRQGVLVIGVWVEQHDGTVLRARITSEPAHAPSSPSYALSAEAVIERVRDWLALLTDER